MTATARFDALGSTAVVGVTDPERLGVARDAVVELVAELDRACSRFRADSELSSVNAAGGEAVLVSPLLLDAVEAALRAAVVTDGDVDPTVGGALVALGYDRDFASVDGASAPRLMPAPGFESVELDRDAGTVRVPRGVTLDLGATAKALGADRAAAHAHDAAGCGVLVSLGGDIAIAGRPPAEGWCVRVTDDHRSGSDAPGQWIAISSGGLATSSTTTRRWSDVHHLVDPRTGSPAAGPWRTVSVAAASCLDANIASTAAIVRGWLASTWLQSLGLPSRLVAQTGRALHVAGWPSGGEELAA